MSEINPMMQKVLIVENDNIILEEQSNLILSEIPDFDTICISDNYNIIDEDFIRNNNIVVVVLDIELNHNISGIDIAKKIRKFKDKKIRNTPIIISSILNKHKESIIKQTKCNYFIAKPFSQEELVLAILHFGNFKDYISKYFTV